MIDKSYIFTEFIKGNKNHVLTCFFGGFLRLFRNLSLRVFLNQGMRRIHFYRCLFLSLETRKGQAAFLLPTEKSFDEKKKKNRKHLEKFGPWSWRYGGDAVTEWIKPKLKLPGWSHSLWRSYSLVKEATAEDETTEEESAPLAQYEG